MSCSSRADSAASSSSSRDTSRSPITATVPSSYAHSRGAATASHNTAQRRAAVHRLYIILTPASPW